MPPENEETVQTDTETTTPEDGIQETDNTANTVSNTGGDSESIVELRKQVADLKKQLTKDTNGISKKLQSQIDGLKNPQQQQQPKSDDDKEALTIEALKNEITSYNQKIDEIKNDYTKRIDQMKLVQEEKERRIFISGVKSNLISSFAQNGFDDLPSVLTVFIAQHPESSFIEGTDGVVIYKKNPKDKNDKGQTLESLVNSWKETAIAKRFIPGDKLPQGGNISESVTPGNTKKVTGKTNIQQVVDKVKSGELEFKSGYY